MYEEVMSAQQDGQVCGLSIFDQSLAFDLLDHNIMNQKIKLLGFDSESCAWFANFLDGPLKICTICIFCFRNVFLINFISKNLYNIA